MSMNTHRVLAFLAWTILVGLAMGSGMAVLMNTKALVGFSLMVFAIVSMPPCGAYLEYAFRSN